MLEPPQLVIVLRLSYITAGKTKHCPCASTERGQLEVRAALPGTRPYMAISFTDFNLYLFAIIKLKHGCNSFSEFRESF